MSTTTKAVKVIFLRAPIELADRIDVYAQANGFKTRTRATLKLIMDSLRNWELTNAANPAS